MASPILNIMWIKCFQKQEEMFNHVNDFLPYIVLQGEEI
jgi:hypothetical protein